jgi:23S rRNA (cytosine1962-C5)-methyltransferase
MLADLLRAALERRASLLSTLSAEGTDCVRLLHGAVEGAPGVAIDRYGPVLLVQTWRAPLEPGQLDALVEVASEAVGAELLGVWNHRAATRRSGRSPDYGLFHDVALPEELWGHELGLRYDVRPRHRGHDPLLFVDFRAGRRRVRAEAEGRSVLNLFAYTCGIGLAAQAGGATEVWNVDFAGSALAVGQGNEAANGLEGQRYLEEDCLPVMRQLAGQKPGGRRGKRPRFTRLQPRTFDLVVLDPPRWARSAFGAVDVVRDYPTLFKPALLATAEGGAVLATNHVASVDYDEWVDVLRRCATKAGRPVRDIERILPEADLPSPDGQPPLKMAWVSC